MARESLFNILHNQYELEGKRVLDLFAGTGSIGFEFASRGASLVDLVEINIQHVRFLIKAKAELNADEVNIFRADALKFILQKDRFYDIIFADPPYNMENFPQVATRVLQSKMLNENGLFILEHSSGYQFKELDGFREHRKYGSVNFSFFSKQIKAS